ncbi:molybdenum cofactor biosynthesis protein B [Weizmannia coagulans]|uniref:Molybdenum cofactor biosynthesis protein B n=3 Tax=Heyndrickxia TaxID=2837504 RepID=G2TND8_HEYCO|nr:MULTISPECIES: molybdenum cofactor biosynthesis protein B [Heyndrickxia]AEP01647.1 molybdenum cofactor synthesis domain protein [Heyndrickxia coagulans 36D1]AJO22213.1 molybdenum cofactor synthesis domain-containing protein [Heyndrickxia coagulans]AKN56251.1 Molybdenum cofactor biosynthesis protein MoaB [Heyndrickxia coagulans]ATW82581.1 molybdenum cofactor biosynthesis protein MoaB [Heyndrickxia coagulans]AVD56761.1 molybdenum cofactor biosynthesis protein MoaB [Heyndrickxia coagulans]
MSTKEHKQLADIPVLCKVITVSDTRTEETDKSGRLIIDLLKQEGTEAAEYSIVKDEAEQIRQAVLQTKGTINAILLNGGTGFTKRDVTVETVRPLLDKEMPGFGELFRYLSYEEIGSASMLSKALAGTIGKKAVFSMPGSSNAVSLAMKKLILPELKHIVWELNRQ